MPHVALQGAFGRLEFVGDWLPGEALKVQQASIPPPAGLADLKLQELRYVLEPPPIDAALEQEPARLERTGSVDPA